MAATKKYREPLDGWFINILPDFNQRDEELQPAATTFKHALVGPEHWGGRGDRTWTQFVRILAVRPRSFLARMDDGDQA